MKELQFLRYDALEFCVMQNNILYGFSFRYPSFLPNCIGKRFNAHNQNVDCKRLCLLSNSVTLDKKVNLVVTGSYWIPNIKSELVILSWCKLHWWCAPPMGFECMPQRMCNWCSLWPLFSCYLVDRNCLYTDYMIIRLPTCGRPGRTISVGSITHLLFLVKKKKYSFAFTDCRLIHGTWGLQRWDIWQKCGCLLFRSSFIWGTFSQSVYMLTLLTRCHA